MSDKTFAADVTFQLGSLVTLIADAVPVKRTGAEQASAFKYICPTCADPTRPSQKYVCPECEGNFWPNDLAKAKELDDGTLRRMSPDEIESLNEGSLDPGTFAIQVCPAEELEARTAPSGQAYRIRLASGKKAKLGKSQAKVYNLIRGLASDTSVALYGVARLNARCNPTPFRLRVWRNQLLLEGLTRPQDLSPAEDIEGDLEPDELTLGKQLLQALSSSFDEDSLADERAKKLAELIATQGQAALASVPAPAKTDDGPDLMALLAASIKAA